MLLNLRGSNLGCQRPNSLSCQYGPSSQILIWDSQEVTHPSTNRARCCLTCELGPQRPELGPRGGGGGCMDGWTDGWMYRRMEILPRVLQDFVPFGSAAQKGEELRKKGRLRPSYSIADWWVCVVGSFLAVGVLRGICGAVTGCRNRLFSVVLTLVRGA